MASVSIVKTTPDTRAARLDPRFYSPDFLMLESRMRAAGAIPLSQMAKLCNRRAVFPKEDGEFRYIDISSIDGETGLILPTSVPVSDAPSRARLQVATGDILVSTVRPNRGVVGIVTPAEDGCVCSTGFAVLSPCGCSSWLLYAAVKLGLTRRQLARYSTSTMYPTVSPADVLKILVPPLDHPRLVRTSAALEKAFDEYATARQSYVEALKGLKDWTL